MKFGRLPRAHDPRIPHFSSLLTERKLLTPPSSCDYTTALPWSLGMYGNDALGDCTCAGVYHAAQIWSANTGAIDTEPDNDAVLLYESACGYVAGQPSTDQGGVEQEVLHHIYRHGFPTGDGSTRKFIHSYVEIDPRNIDDVAQGIYGSGLVYIGFNVPDYLPMSPGSTWDYTPGQKYSIQGGHCVVLPAYDLAARNFKAISWGSVYEMTTSFFTAFVDEAYALVDLGWFNATGLTPAGIPFATLEASMQALRS